MAGRELWAKEYKALNDTQRKEWLNYLRGEGEGEYKQFVDEVYSMDSILSQLPSLNQQARLDYLGHLSSVVPEKFDEVQKKGYLKDSKWGRAIAETPGVKALGWWQEKVAKPLAASAWSIGVQMQPGEQQGEQHLKDAGSWDWGARVKGYGEWDSPSWDTGVNVMGSDITLGVKGALEIGVDPLTYVTGGGVLRGGKAITGGAAKGSTRQAIGEGITKTGQAITKIENAPLTALRKVTGKGKPQPLVDDLIDFDTQSGIMFREDNARSLSNLPVIRNIIGKVNPAGVANDPASQMIVLRAAARDEGVNRVNGIMASNIDSIGRREKLFGKESQEGFLTGVFEGDNITLNTLRSSDTALQKYDKVLTKEQREWIGMANRLENEKLAMLERNGIEIDKIGFDEGMPINRYAGRRVIAKFDAENNITDVGYVGRGAPGKIGAKAPFSKHRSFDTMEEGIEAGFRYIPEDEALRLNMIGAYNTVANKKAADWLLDKVPWRTTGARLDVMGQKSALNEGVTALRATIKNDHVKLMNYAKMLPTTAKEAERIEKLLRVTLAKKERIQVNISNAKDLRRATDYLKAQLRVTQKEANRLVNKYNKLGEEYTKKTKGSPPEQVLGQKGRIYKKIEETQAHLSEMQSKLDIYEPVWMEKVARKQTPTYDEASLGLEHPAFIGKIFTGPDAKKTVRTIQEGMTPKFSNALNSVNKVNAVGRFFALAGDVSPFTIQLLFMASSNPKVYAKAMKGFAGAFRDPDFHARYLRNHNHTVRKSPNLILTKGGGTEFTEAMAQGGILSGQPIVRAGEGLAKTTAMVIPRVYGKVGRAVLTPFQRGFEAAMDVAGIELKEAYEHLGTTAYKNAEIDQFVNEFRGVTSSARLGVSAQQRQIETAVLLAPRYNRAIASLMFDIFKGNIRGDLARQSMAKGIGGLAALTVGITLADEMRKGKSIDEAYDKATERLNPTSREFMNFEVAGQKIGPGSKVRSILAYWGAIANDPSSAGQRSINLLRGNTSPVVSTAWDVWSGKDYIGNSTRDNHLQLTDTVIGENLMPIWAHSTFFEEGGVDPVRAVGEFAGLRTRPLNIWEQNEYEQNKLSQDAYNLDYGQLNDEQKGQLDRDNPDLAERRKEAEDEWLKVGGSKTEKAYTLAVRGVKERFDQEMSDYATIYVSQDIDMQKYNDLRGEALLRKSSSIQIAMEMKSIAGGSEFDYEAWIGENKTPDDVALHKYNQFFYNKDKQIFQENGLVDWGATEHKANQWLGTQKLDMQSYVLRNQDAWMQDLPEDAKSMEMFRKEIANTLESHKYWDVRDSVMAGYPRSYKNAYEEYQKLIRSGKNQDDIVQMGYGDIVNVYRQIERDVSKIREHLRRQDPQLDYAVRVWY